jgi:hypothetical protein
MALIGGIAVTMWPSTGLDVPVAIVAERAAHRHHWLR